MKRILTAIAAVLAALCLSVTLSADVEEFKENILSELEEADTSGVSEGLKSAGLDPDNPSDVSGLSAGGILSYVMGIAAEAFRRPIKIILIAAVMAAVCQVASTLSYKVGLYGELFVIICFIAISPYALDAFDSAVSAMLSCRAFMLSYIPAFAAIAASSGNIAAAVSYNAMVLYFCEIAANFAASVLKPILACMLVMSVTQAVNPDLSNITSTVRRALTTVIGFIMTLFLGVIGLRSLAGQAAESLAVKAGKYAVSSFVPIIGYSLSESYKAVSVSLSAIRTAVGTFGIVVLCLFMLSPIITLAIYKGSFMLCSVICRLCGADRLGAMMDGLADVFSFAATVLTVFMLMLTVATGMLILLGGGAVL